MYVVSCFWVGYNIGFLLLSDETVNCELLSCCNVYGQDQARPFNSKICALTSQVQNMKSVVRPRRGEDSGPSPGENQAHMAGPLTFVAGSPATAKYGPRPRDPQAVYFSCSTDVPSKTSIIVSAASATTQMLLSPQVQKCKMLVLGARISKELKKRL